jgi:hypothetical protein
VGSMADLEQTLEAKVKALGLDGGPLGGSVTDAQGLQGKLKADSLDAVLRQALESEDKVLLQQCLGVTDIKVIQASRICSVWNVFF